MARMTGVERGDVRSFKVFDAHCGDGTFLITVNDDVYGIGNNGQDINILGLTGSYYRCGKVDRPVRVEKLSRKRIQEIRVGGIVGAALDVDGKLYWWGQDLAQEGEVRLPQLATDKHRFQCVSCGSRMMAALNVSGDVYVWGQHRGMESPYFMKHLEIEEPIISLSCGHDHLAMASVTGVVFTWGVGTDGQRGYSSHPSSSEDDIVMEMNFDYPCETVICGTLATFCLTTAGELWACGGNGTHCGVLGVDNENYEVFFPEKVQLPGKVIFLNAMWNYCRQTIYCSLTTEGLYWWCEERCRVPSLAPDQSVAGLLNVFRSPHDSMILIDHNQTALSESNYRSPIGFDELDISLALSSKVCTKVNEIITHLREMRNQINMSPVLSKIFEINSN
uniref:X-linked retinitis pigmentosa GTPase regulator n=1 Tax=Lygus hesperus TaxID=30085 RepID=A0A146L5Q5_LYGHE